MSEFFSVIVDQQAESLSGGLDLNVNFLGQLSFIRNVNAPDVNKSGGQGFAPVIQSGYSAQNAAIIAYNFIK